MEQTSKMKITLSILMLILLIPYPAKAMHISEGILPLGWAGFWYLIAIPFVWWGIRDLRSRSAESPHYKSLVALVGAAVFIISCMPIPVPVAGSCSHPCGTGLAAIIVGPSITVMLTSITLILQALFLAHGGLTTLGADIVSMGVAGAFLGYGSFKLSIRLGAPAVVAAMAAGVLSDWATYFVTSLELSTALHTPGSFFSLLGAIIIAFMPTQIPLGLFEGIVSGGAYRFIMSRRPELILTQGFRPVAGVKE